MRHFNIFIEWKLFLFYTKTMKNTFLENCVKTFSITLGVTGLTLMMYGEIPPAPIKVGVIDSGVFVGHDFFHKRPIHIVNLNEKSNSSQSDEIGHGTHVAGIIFSRTYENTEIYSLKNIFINSKDSLTSDKIQIGSHNQKLDYYDDFQIAIEKSHALGIKILNISQYIVEDVQDYTRLVSIFRKAEQYGILVLVASGNDRENLDLKERKDNVYPCALKLSNMICVGSINSLDEVTSNFGKYYVDIWANGNFVLSTYKNNNYIRMSGSSMATPKISALAARLWAHNPEMSAPELKSLLLSKLAYSPALAKVSTYGLFLQE